MKFRLQDRALFGVGADRYVQGKKLEANVDVFLLDDGFQHLRLARDVNILLIDAAQPLARQTCSPRDVCANRFPPWSAPICLCSPARRPCPALAPRSRSFRSYPGVFLRPPACSASAVSARESRRCVRTKSAPGPSMRFAASATRPAFFQDLKNWNFTLAGQCEFADHHRYDARDAAELEAAARTARATALITTEKDAQNLAGVQFAAVPGVHRRNRFADFERGDRFWRSFAKSWKPGSPRHETSDPCHELGR